MSLARIRSANITLEGIVRHSSRAGLAGSSRAAIEEWRMTQPQQCASRKPTSTRPRARRREGVTARCNAGRGSEPPEDQDAMPQTCGTATRDNALQLASLRDSDGSFRNVPTNAVSCADGCSELMSGTRTKVAPGVVDRVVLPHPWKAQTCDLSLLNEVFECLSVAARVLLQRPYGILQCERLV